LVAWVISQERASTPAAWIALASLYLFLLECGLTLARGRRFPGILFIWIFLSGVGGIFAAGLGQIEVRFSDEEFLSALQALILSLYWAILFGFCLLARFLLFPRTGSRPSLSGKAVGFFLAFFILTGGLVILNGYQTSFYPLEAPAYPGITEESPFICGETAADPQTYNGEEVFQNLLALIGENPQKSVPEYGMLALGSGEPFWIGEFRVRLLEEMQNGRFTAPSNSVKYSQFEAALRVYYYSRIQREYPELFSQAENQNLRAWFAAINRRAWSVEWTDWLYALAFKQLPVGIFLNQEIGSGLLALLELEDLADAQLSAKNRAYLNAQPQGWQTHFRNTDDAIDYQQEWIYNALFQSRLSGQFPQEVVQRSFDWLGLQALPDGSSLRINHPVPLVQTGIAYLGASLLQDPQLLWISGRSLDYFSAISGQQTAVPGLDDALDLTGQSPQAGSCLLYGDSGLPTRRGPLAPDKIVFRDGWSKDSAYLLVNLRFSGWHRYKGSGTITQIYQEGQLAGEQVDGQVLDWLPAGRSQFRDKRIPRENLNGLLIERSGLSAVLHTLTRLGNPWAQDPPYYARVESFETGAHLDQANVLLEDWHGWDHSRRIYFYHQGPILILDQANGPADRKAALTWHLSGDVIHRMDRYILRSGVNAAELALIPLDSEGGKIETQHSTASQDFQVQYLSPTSGTLAIVTVFLTRDWTGANWSLQPASAGWEITLQQGDRQLVLDLPRFE